jgi:hypothetical protein
MSFVGPVDRFGDAYIRPHDLELSSEPNGATQEAMVERLAHLGFEVRVELVRDDGTRLSARAETRTSSLTPTRYATSSKRRQISRSAGSRSRNASTTTGSNWRPDWARISAPAASHVPRVR